MTLNELSIHAGKLLIETHSRGLIDTWALKGMTWMWWDGYRWYRPLIRDGGWQPWMSQSMLGPDLSDPLTVKAMELLLREATGVDSVVAIKRWNDEWSVSWTHGAAIGNSEAEAYVNAFENLLR